MYGREPVAIGGGGGGMRNLSTNNLLRRQYSSNSCGSDDLAVMVSDFLEIGSSGTDSWCSSDGDSGFSDLDFLADNISVYKKSVDQFETNLAIIVKSLILSINETNQIGKPDACNSSCILYNLVKLLQSSGYDVALCASKWQGIGKIPGGEHEYIDVITHKKDGATERYIIDVDFRSHFQIARAIKPYSIVLSSLPPIYVGTMTKLKKILQIMAEAAKYSLEQNSMPLPPWRSLAYLKAKWESPCERIVNLHTDSSSSSSHQQCIGLLRRMKSFVQYDVKLKTLVEASQWS